MTHRPSRRLRAATLLASLLLSNPVPFVPSMAHTAQAAPPTDIERFDTSTFTFCDAEFLASYWSETTFDAKIHIGRKLNAGGSDFVRAALTTAREQAVSRGERCDFFESAYNYDDAALLAKLWGVEVGDAKSIIEDKLTHGHDALVKSALIEAVSMNDARDNPGSDPASAEVDRFFSSAFTYCDARLLADHWAQDIMESKARIGRKLIWGDDAVVHEMLSDARTAARKRGAACQFFETGLAFEDVEKLAAHWKVSLTDAKTRAADIFTEGRSADLRSILSPTSPKKPTP